MKNSKDNKVQPYLIMGLIALLILVIALLIKPENVATLDFIYDALVNIAFIFVTIVIVNYVWSLLGGDPVENLFKDGLGAYELYSDGFERGLLRANPIASDYASSSEWMKIIGAAKKSVDMMGYSLRTFTGSKEFAETLKEIAQRGVQVRIMIMHEDNEHLPAGLNKNVTVSHNTKIDIALCKECVKTAINELIGDQKNNIQLRCIKIGITEMQIIRVDDKIYVTPYLYSMNTSDSPLFVCKERKNGYYPKYQYEFNELWKLNESQNEEETQVSTVVQT